MSQVTAAAAVSRLRRFVRSAGVAAQRRRWAAAFLILVSGMSGLVALYLMKPDDRVLAAPMLTLIMITVAFVMTLWALDGSPPVFESGTLCLLATAIYGSLPLAGFLMMHGQWDARADGRLQAYPFISGELGAFGWRYALYVGVFAATYLLVRGRATVRTTNSIAPSPYAQAAIVVLLFLLFACKVGLKVVFGYDEEGGPDVYQNLAAVAARWYATPLVLRQVGHNVISALFLVHLAVIVLLLVQWRKRWCRYTLILWLGSEIVLTTIRLGSRGKAVLLLMSAGILYHRLVKRFSFLMLTIAGIVVLSGFLIMGAVRELRTTAPSESVHNVLTADNEFQALFATAFDLHKRKEAGQISVPWQIYLSDFYFPIPSQLLPFQKIDPGAWYLEVIGLANTGVGFMFGVMAQAAVGFDWVELVIRAAVLAAFLALLHRWYVRRAASFWPTLFYLFVGIWTYYSVRASSFYFLYFLLYHFVPVLLAAKILERLLSHARSGTADGQPTVVHT